jgi:hypothetical protein
MKILTKTPIQAKPHLSLQKFPHHSLRAERKFHALDTVVQSYFVRRSYRSEITC